jgi:hypothetical protein
LAQQNEAPEQGTRRKHRGSAERKPIPGLPKAGCSVLHHNALTHRRSAATSRYLDYGLSEKRFLIASKRLCSVDGTLIINRAQACWAWFMPLHQVRCGKAKDD